MASRIGTVRPAYLGRWLPEARRWLHANAPELAERPTWLFQSGPCGPAGATPQQVSRPIAKLAFAIGSICRSPSAAGSIRRRPATRSIGRSPPGSPPA